VLNPVIADFWSGDKPPKLQLGMLSVIAVLNASLSLLDGR